jgi:hypothetical protein
MIATATTSRQQTLFCDRESLQEWKVTMRTSNTRARKFSSTVVKILMALVFASMIGGISGAPAFGFYIYAPPVVVDTPTEYVSPGIDLAFPIEIGGGGGGYYGGGGYGGGYGGGHGGRHGGGHRGGGHRGGGRR